MQVRFLLGPAGSGKTHRCLAEVRAELVRAPEGPPLIFLAPKQATFQVERQLLASPELAGYTRLRILSFERLAAFALDALDRPQPGGLSEEARLMVLRALLLRHRGELKIFRASAHLEGFVRQVSDRLRQCRRDHLGAERLEELAGRTELDPTLRAKLGDLALLARAYGEWLRAHGLRDAEALLDAAAEALRAGDRRLGIEALWLDGFAELSAQELELLAALVPHCQRATLAFCLPAESHADVSWRSPWSPVAETARRCRARLEAIPGVEISIEPLPTRPGQNRFARSPALAQLEARLAGRMAPAEASLTDPGGAIRLVICRDVEAEAVYAAREILRAVRVGARFRDCAVLVRRLDPYHAALSRVLRRYGIPFFMDRREPVSHHPLAELTRSAMRLATYGWQHQDWFGALKTGLVRAAEADLDRLENAALEHGWTGRMWLQPHFGRPQQRVTEAFEELRARLTRPFANFADALAAGPPSGVSSRQLAAAIRTLWAELEVERTLAVWAETVAERFLQTNVQSEVHAAVLDQMHEWLDHLVLAFGDERLPPEQWLPILEAGLAHLTVGVIPPALDQVLVGAVDRSRNPELKLVLLLGLNEGLFPVRAEPGPLLTAAECAQLQRLGVRAGLSEPEQFGRERYLAYIACTRAGQRLVISCARRDATGRASNPSLFFHELEQLTGLKAVEFDAPTRWTEAEHSCELDARVAAVCAGRAAGLPDEADAAALAQVANLPVFEPIRTRVSRVREALALERLQPATVEALYGTELETAIVALEDFAACPFRFFAARGLRLEERRLFEYDERDLGRFQHAVLHEFHRRVRATGRHWRHLNAVEARVIVRDIAETLLPDFEGGRFGHSAAARFAAELAVERLDRLIGVLIDWMEQYEFDPVAAELEFGLQREGLPAWRLALSNGRALVLRGRVDRLDLHFRDEEALAVVMDYKSSGRQFDPVKLHHGLELQLFAYLRMLEQLRQPERFFEIKRLVPAGVFYVPVNGNATASLRARTRHEARHNAPEHRLQAYQHSGRFRADVLDWLDNRRAEQGDQFRYRRNRDGTPSASSKDPVEPGRLNELLAAVEAHIRSFAERIFEGDVAVSPYRLRTETACDHCAFREVCRFDPWVQPYRRLSVRPSGSPRHGAEILMSADAPVAAGPEEGA